MYAECQLHRFSLDDTKINMYSALCICILYTLCKLLTNNKLKLEKNALEFQHTIEVESNMEIDFQTYCEEKNSF